MLGLRDANPNALALIVSLGQQRIRDLDRLRAHRGCKIAHGSFHGMTPLRVSS
jgi:hypothetical protein